MGTSEGGAPDGPPLSHRDLAILRAVGRNTAEIVVGAEPDLFLDGRCCCDQMAAHRLARAGLIVAAVPGTVGQRVLARLTVAARRLVGPTPVPAGAPAAERSPRPGARRPSDPPLAAIA